MEFDLASVSDESSFYFPEELAESIRLLWKDSIMPKLMDHHSSEFYLMDSAS